MSKPSDIGQFKLKRTNCYEYDSLFSSHGGQAEILFGLNYSPLTGKLPHKYYTGTKHYLRTIIGWTVEGITLQKSHNTKGTWYFCNIDFTWWQLQGKVISPQSHPTRTPTLPYLTLIHPVPNFTLDVLISPQALLLLTEFSLWPYFTPISPHF